MARTLNRYISIVTFPLFTFSDFPYISEFDLKHLIALQLWSTSLTCVDQIVGDQQLLCQVVLQIKWIQYCCYL